MSEYICKKATQQDIEIHFKEKSEKSPRDSMIFDIWKNMVLDRINNNLAIVYYGYIDGHVVCEITAALKPEVIKNPKDVIDEKTVYLMNIETDEGYRKKGYFSKLLTFALADLKSLGYERVTLSYYTDEKNNEEIYKAKGFIEPIKKSSTVLPNGEKKELQYCGKKL